jgi:hypothetical protein
MDNIYKRVVSEAVKSLAQAGIVDPTKKDEVDKIRSGMSEYLKNSKLKVKLVDDPVAKRREASDGRPKCEYKIVTKNGRETRLCNVLVKSPYSLYCDRHVQMESNENPETYLRRRFGGNFAEKCRDVTGLARKTEGISAGFTSEQGEYKIYEILYAVEEYGALYYAVKSKMHGWDHRLAAVIDPEDENRATLGSKYETACRTLKIFPIPGISDVLLRDMELVARGLTG